MCDVTTFVIYMDHITKETNPDMEMLNELLFANDQSIISEKKQHLQNQVSRLNIAYEEYNIWISISKPKVMSVSRSLRKISNNINRSSLQQTNVFQYLGSIFIQDGTLNREFDTKAEGKQH